MSKPNRRRIAAAVAYVDEPALVVDVVPDPRRRAGRAGSTVHTISRSAFTSRKWMSGLYWKTIGRRESRPKSASRTSGRARARRRIGDADRRLAGHPDLDVGRAVAGEHRSEAGEQEVAQLLGHPLAADERVQLVVGPREPAAVALVEEVLQERRIAGDEEPVAGSEVAERREDLVDVRADRLDDAVAHHPEAHVEAGGPRPHRERVDRHEGPGAERVAGEEADVPMGDLALAAAADPVVRACPSSRSTRRSSCPGTGRRRRRTARGGRTDRRRSACPSRAGAPRMPSGNSDRPRTPASAGSAGRPARAGPRARPPARRGAGRARRGSGPASARRASSASRSAARRSGT